MKTSVAETEVMKSTTLSTHLAALSQRPDVPADVRESLAVAARHTEHVSGCTTCRRWTDDPDDLGRCDDCSVRCDGCGEEAERRDDLTLTPCGGEDKWLCEQCVEDRAASRRAHPRSCGCDRCMAQREDAQDARRELAREVREVRT